MRLVVVSEDFVPSILVGSVARSLSLLVEVPDKPCAKEGQFVLAYYCLM